MSLRVTDLYFYAYILMAFQFLKDFSLVYSFICDSFDLTFTKIKAKFFIGLKYLFIFSSDTSD